MRSATGSMVGLMLAVAGQPGVADECAYFKNPSDRVCVLKAGELISVLRVNVSVPGQAAEPGYDFHGSDRIVVPARATVSLRDTAFCPYYRFTFAVHHQGEDEPDYHLVCTPGSSGPAWELKQNTLIGAQAAPAFQGTHTVIYKAPAEGPVSAVAPAPFVPAALAVAAPAPASLRPATPSHELSPANAPAMGGGAP